VWDVVIFRIPLQMSANRTAKIDGPRPSAMELMPSIRRAKINDAKQASASTAKDQPPQ
jgi:hypothetical protein